jgi:hypothetical protein
MVVDVNVPPAVVLRIARGDRAIVRIAESGQEYPGHVRTIAPLPGKAGDHAIEVEFPNPNGALLAGRIADVRLVPGH